MRDEIVKREGKREREIELIKEMTKKGRSEVVKGGENNGKAEKKIEGRKETDRR